MTMEKEYLIKKWLKDELTPEELDAFKALEDVSSYENIVETAKQFKASEVATADDFETFNKRFKNKKKASSRFVWSHPLLRIASVVIIAVGLYFTLFYNSMTQVATLAQEKTTVELPDASEVTLNAMSKIEFNADDWADKRVVKLEGEAYFDVEKGKTFDVLTSQGIVTVVGTEFSVKQRDDYFEVNCFEGVVKVSSGQWVETLTASKTFRILGGKMSQGTTELSKPQWLGAMSNFEALPFVEVVNELERQYDIEIKLKDLNQNRLFSGGFVHDNLDNALMSITQPLNLTYKKLSPKQVLIYGHKK